MRPPRKKAIEATEKSVSVKGTASEVAEKVRLA
jgi:hypothetical protein